MENQELFARIQDLNPESKQKLINLLAVLTYKEDDSAVYSGFGSLKGRIWMSDDFDAPLKAFHEYSYTMSLEFVNKIEKLTAKQQQELELIADEMLKSNEV